MKCVISLMIVLLSLTVPQYFGGLSSGDVIIEPIPFEAGIFEKIMNRIINPYIRMITATLQRIKDSIRNKMDNLSEIINQEINELVHLTKKHVIRLADLVSNIGGDVDDLLNSVKNTLVKILYKMDDINEDIKKILLQVVDRYIEKLREIIHERINEKEEIQEFGLLYDLQRKLGDIIIRPILFAIITIIEQHPELREKLNSGSELIRAELNKISDMIQPHVNRVVSLMRLMGADIKAVAESLKSTLVDLLEKLNLIAEKNLTSFKTFLHHFVNKLMGIADEEVVGVLQESYGDKAAMNNPRQPIF